MSSARTVSVPWPDYPPYDGARLVIVRLAEAGYRAWIVGGAVRDLLRGAPAADADVATDATPDAVMRLWPAAVPTGLAHGTVSVPVRGRYYEVTTLRSDGPYADARRPSSVQFTHNLEEDLARRDFTVNAMALSLDGGLTDPFAGREDLARRVIRAVGDPTTRFAEDGLRVARAYRFAATLDFSVETGTAAAAERSAVILSRVSAERRREEWFKWLPGVTPSVCATLPQAVYAAWVNGETGVASLCRLLSCLPGDLFVRLAGVAGLESKREHAQAPWPVHRGVVSRWLSRLRVSRADAGHVLALLDLAELWRTDEPSYVPLTAAGAVSRVGRERIWLAVVLAGALSQRPVDADQARRRVDEWWAKSPVHSLGELAANGSQVQSWSGVKGREVGLLLAHLYDLAAHGCIANDPRQLAEAARAWATRKEAKSN